MADSFDEIKNGTEKDFNGTNDSDDNTLNLDILGTTNDSDLDFVLEKRLPILPDVDLSKVNRKATVDYQTYSKSKPNSSRGHK